MKLYLSNNLKEKLKSIDCKISNDILFNDGKLNSKITYIDLSNVLGYLSFMSCDKVDNSLDNFIQNKNRDTIKIGRFINKIFPGRYSSSQIEYFTNKFKSIDDTSDEKMELVSGRKITKWYTSDILDPCGNLINSCMNNRLHSTFKIYSENRGVKLLVLLKDNKLAGRALVWKIKSINDKSIKAEYFMDRVYYTKEHYLHKMINYAKKMDWCYKSIDSGYLQDIITYNNKTYYGVKLCVKLENYKFGKFPYLDTFSRLKRGKLYNDTEQKKGGHILRNVDGSYTKEKSFLKKIIDFIID